MCISFLSEQLTVHAVHYFSNQPNQSHTFQTYMGLGMIKREPQSDFDLPPKTEPQIEFYLPSTLPCSSKGIVKNKPTLEIRKSTRLIGYG